MVSNPRFNHDFRKYQLYHPVDHESILNLIIKLGILIQLKVTYVPTSTPSNLVAPGPNISITPLSIENTITYEPVVFYELFKNGSFQILYINGSFIFYPLNASNTHSKLIDWISSVNGSALDLNFWSPIYSENIFFSSTGLGYFWSGSSWSEGNWKIGATT